VVEHGCLSGNLAAEQQVFHQRFLHMQAVLASAAALRTA
jgi:hypothetical protein